MLGSLGFIIDDRGAMRFLLRIFVTALLVLWTVPGSLEATNQGNSVGNDKKDLSSSFDQGSNNQDNHNGSSSSGQNNDNDHPGHSQGNGHTDHGNGNGYGHDHHDDDPPISPWKPEKELSKYACSVGQAFGFPCF
jgi:hypothetical protein